MSLHDLGRHEESLKYYDRALQLARLVGDIRLQAYAMMDRAAAMTDLELYPEAGTMLQEAKRLVQVLEERDTLFLIDITEGQREMGLGRWNRATRLFDRGLRGLKEFGGVTDYARALIYVGRFYLAQGERDSGLKILQEARAIARRLGNPALAAQVEDLAKGAESSGLSTRAGAPP